MILIAESKGKKLYRSGNDSIKVFDEEFSKADVLNEALNQARSIPQTAGYVPVAL